MRDYPSKLETWIIPWWRQRRLWCNRCPWAHSDINKWLNKLTGGKRMKFPYREIPSNICKHLPSEKWASLPFGWVWTGLRVSLLVNRLWEEKNSKFTVGKPGRPHVFRVTQVNIPRGKACWYQVPRLDVMSVHRPVAFSPEPQSIRENITQAQTLQNCQGH